MLLFTNKDRIFDTSMIVTECLNNTLLFASSNKIK